MKAFAKILGLVAICSVSLFAQCVEWTSSTIRACNGYDYELWSQNNAGTVKMTITGDNGSGANAKGGTFTATWKNTQNVLFRSGKKWGSSSTTTVSSIGNAVIDFAATWSSTDNVKMLGVYGWAYYPAGSLPTKDENGTSRSYTNQIEYYIIQDRGSYNSASQGTNSKKYGEATIDGIVYELYVADRINQPDLSGGNGNFKQYFSVPKSTSSHRSSGIISVYEHFKAWDKAGMKMLDCRLYEIAMKVESYTGSGSSDGSATVTKNLLTIGGSSTPSSNSGGGSSSSAGGGTYSSSARSSSSVSSGTQICGEYQTSFCGGMAYASVTGGSTTIPTTGGCLFIGDFEIIQPSLSSTIAINGVENTCGADWADCAYNSKPPTKDGGYYVYVKSGTVNSYQDNGWQGIIAKAKPSCTASSSSAAVSSSSSAISSSSSAGSSSSTQLSSSSAGGTTFALENRVPVTYFSMQSFSGKTLRIETSSPTVVEVFDLKGNKAASFNVLSTSETVKLSLPNGVYFAKVQGIKNIKFMLK